jgi:hypothetical protein
MQSYEPSKLTLERLCCSAGFELTFSYAVRPNVENHKQQQLKSTCMLFLLLGSSSVSVIVASALVISLPETTLAGLRTALTDQISRRKKKGIEVRATFLGPGLVLASRTNDCLYVARLEVVFRMLWEI